MVVGRYMSAIGNVLLEGTKRVRNMVEWFQVSLVITDSSLTIYHAPDVVIVS